MAQNSPNPSTQATEQNVQNLSFDPTFKVLAVEMLGFDGTNLQRVQVDANGKLVANAV